jgi:hypothetical protein
MKWIDRVGFYLEEGRREGGYKALATRLSRDLGKRITPKQVKNYLSKLEKTEVVKDIKKRSREAKMQQAYEWGTKYKILKNHFS